MSRNSKYYMKSVSTNKVRSKDIISLFSDSKKKKIDDNNTASTTTVVHDDDGSEYHDLNVCSSESLELSESLSEPSLTLTKLAASPSLTSLMTVHNLHSASISSTASSSTSSDTVSVPLPTESVSSSTPDMRKIKTVRNYEQLFPDFYPFDGGYFCKVCTEFAVRVGQEKRPFIEVPGHFADHPTERANGHVTSNRHKEALKNRQTYRELAHKHTDIMKMLTESALSKEIEKRAANRFVIKSFFHATYLLVRKYWAHTNNFTDLINLVAECGGK